MIVAILDKLLEFCASLKLAICVILSLAFYLAAATFYEARYGTRAVQEVIYGSQPFVLLMALLSINVMAAVVVRYPWKRKQTGFIITHAGIEVLLLGCLLSFRYSVDGRMSLEPGQKTEVINLNDEDVSVTMPDAGGKPRVHSFPISLWHDAGYPGLARYVANAAATWAVDLAADVSDSLAHTVQNATRSIRLPASPRWPDGHTVVWPLGEGAQLEVLTWLPAGDPETIVKPTDAGFPAAIVHLGGHLPNGMAMDQNIPLLADGEGNGMVRPFGGALEMNLWKARSADEVNEFLNPPPQASLPEEGRVDVFLGGQRYSVDVTKDAMGKDQPLGDSGYKAAVEDYILNPPPPQLPENHGQAAMAAEPIDPQISFRLTGPLGVRKYLLAAWHPQFVAHLDNADPTQHGSASPDDPLMWYWHPQTYFTTKEGTRGRLWLLQSPDNRLYVRMFQLEQADQKSTPPFEAQIGKELRNFWLNISLTITQFCPSGTLVNQFQPADVEPRQMDDHERAIKVALVIDGTRQETWLERGADAPIELNTPRGPIQLQYDFREYPLGFAIGLDHAEQTNDPGSNEAAAYTSGVTVMGSPKLDGQHTITMNEPLTVSGLTFYQAGMANVQGTSISTLSVRYDPGWIIKYLGCALIVGGIFTMFYMKAYFQKKPTQAIASKTNAINKPAGVAVVGKSAVTARTRS
jgi:hypothetical protein